VKHPPDEADLLRRINRNAEGVLRDGQKVAVLLPNGKRFGLEFSRERQADHGCRCCATGDCAMKLTRSVRLATHEAGPLLPIEPAADRGGVPGRMAPKGGDALRLRGTF
jgi:hypothetical protein